MKILHFFECCPMCLLQMGALRKDHSEFLHRDYQSTPKNLFSQGVTWKRGGVMDPKSYCWGDSDCTQGENFSQWEQSTTGIISPGKSWIPQYWTHSRFGWAGCWATLSTPCFTVLCQERLNQIIPEVPLHPPILPMLCKSPPKHKECHKGLPLQAWKFN